MEYELRRRWDMKIAIFDEDGNQISPDWFDKIWEYGLFEGKSVYYAAKKNGKVAIFDVNGNMITPEWFDMVDAHSLIMGKSNYYIARKNNKYAIFDKDRNQISQWFDYIWGSGLVSGDSDYYIACKDKTCAVYHKNGQKVSDDFSIKYFDLIGVYKATFNEDIGIVEIKDSEGNLVKTVDFNPVYPFKEEIIDYTKLLNI